ncbi:MAG: phosphatase PAP2 family protein, partial [Elusimicrobia bacterium]|nr:phosphatase PAP2 family protein [Elusimicrobiota bacterium]
LSLTATSLSTAAVVSDRLQIKGDYVYSKPHLLTFLKNQPGDLKDFSRMTFRKENIWLGVGIAAVTGVMIAKDQQIYEETYKLGDRLKISHQGQQRAVARIYNPFAKKNMNILSVPNDLGTALYFLGDGYFHTMITLSFLGYGFAASDNRALQTSSQIAEAIIAETIIVQTLKHVTGRENPNTLERPGGKWRFFPNQIQYHKHVNKYDAFPSGHLPTALVTVTVISENYPEHVWIRPLGYTLMTGLAFQMINNGVHWMSDYPLTLYLGYVYAKIAVNKGRIKRLSADAGTFELAPALVGNGLGIRAIFRFY